MLEMMKNTWKKMQDNWLQLSLGGLGVLGVATFNVVFPPSLIPTLAIVALAALSTTIYFAVNFVKSYFFKKEAEAVTAPVAQTEKQEEVAAPTAEVEKKAEASSTAKMQITLEANKTVAVAAPAATTTVATDKATVVAGAATTAANNEAVIEEAAEEEAQADDTLTFKMN